MSTRKIKNLGVLRNGASTSGRSGATHASVSGWRPEALPSGAGFYLISSPRVGVIKLGMSGGGSGVAARVGLADKYWGGDMLAHDIRSFQHSPGESDDRAGTWRDIQYPRAFAAKFEKAVKDAIARELTGWNGEFYMSSSDEDRRDMIRKVLRIVQRVERSNRDPRAREDEYADFRKSKRQRGMGPD